MHLLSPWFAALVALGALPVLIHLHGRRRAKVRKLPTLLLLHASHRRVAQRTRLRHVMLLLLRVLVMVAIPLLLAKPYIETTSDLPAQISAPQSAVLVLDDSLSLRSRPESGLRSGTLLEQVKKQAARLVEALPPGAQAAVVLGSRGGAAPVPELTADRARLFSAISAVQPSFRGTDLPTALKRAAQILQTVGPQHRAQRRVYVITDAAVHAIEAGMQPPSGIEVAVIDVSDGKPRPNRALVDVRADAALSLGPRAVRVTAEVANHGDMPVKELPITLVVDGRPVAKGLLDLPARGHAVKRFVHILQPPPETSTSPAPSLVPPGLHHVSVRLDPDLLPEDDERHLRVEVQRTLRVLILDGDPRTLRRDDEAFYLEMALRPGEREDTGIQVTTQPLDEATPALGDLDAVFLVNAKAQDVQRKNLLAPLLAYVQKGGGLFIALGDNVDVDAYNSTLGELLPQPLAVVKTTGPVARRGDESMSGTESAPSGPGERMGRIDRRHPILSPFGAGHASDSLLAARFDRYFLLKPTPRSAAEGSTVVLSFESGAPALVERALGRGKVLLFTSTLDRDWNSLPIQPAFLPLLQQAVRYLSREPLRETEQPTLIGQPRDIRLSSGDTRVEVTLPSGQKRLFDRLSGRQVLTYLDTIEPGLYRVATGSDTALLRPRASEYFVVNIDPAETDLQAAPPQRVQQLTRPLLDRAPADPAGQSGASAPRRRVELWHTLGALLLILLVGEALLLRQR